MKSSRIKSIELWRVFFIIMVVVHHSNYLPGFRGGNELFRSWYSVNFFFMLSGYLMAKRSEKPLEGTLGEDSWKFIFHKIKGFYPMYLMAVILNLVLRCSLTDFEQYSKVFKYYLWDLLLVRAAGITGATGAAVAPTWYLMAMMLAMAILYPLMKKNKDVFLCVLAPLLTVFLFGWFSQVYGVAFFAMVFEHGVCLGLIRAIAGISLGCVVYLICQKLKTLTFKRIKLIRIVATLAELLIALFLVMTSIREFNGQIDFVCIFLEALLLLIEFGGFSLINDAVKNWRIGWIGNFTMALFLSHYIWVSVLVDMKPEWPGGVTLAVYFGASILSSIALIWIMKGIRRLIAWINTIGTDKPQPCV